MSLEVAKKSRSGIRRAFTKLVKDIETVLATKDQTIDVTKLKSMFAVLEVRNQDLLAQNFTIYELMLTDTNISDTEVDEGLNKADEYALKFSHISVFVSEYVEQDKASNVSDQSKKTHLTSPSFHGFPDIHVSGACGNSQYKLPNMRLKEFGGEISDWLPFWDQFKKIHVDRKLDPSDKMHYLLMSITPNSPARAVVDSFPATSEMYPEVVKALKQRFGRDDLLTEFYIRELLRIILQNMASTQKLALSVLYDKVQSHFRNLDSLGVTIEKCAPILLPLVSSCLHTDVLKTWERKGSSGDDTSSKTMLQNLLDFLICEVEGEQKISMSLSGFGLSSKSTSTNVDSKKPKKVVESSSNDVSTAAGLLTTVKESSPKVCIFCSQSHKPQDCSKAVDMSVVNRRKIVSEKRACFCCLRVGHSAKMCRNRPKCVVRQKAHYPVVCEGITKNTVGTAHDTSPSSVSGTRKSETLASLVAPCNVLMQTLLVNIMNGRKKRTVRALIDTASQRTYILDSTAVEMGYEPKRSETIQHSLFGGVNSMVSNHNVYTVHLSSLEGGYCCNFEALNQTKICGDISPVLQGPWLSELADSSIFLSDVGTRGPIEVLIGADIAGKLLSGGHRALSSGLVAVQTKLGWTLMGKVPEVRERGVAMLVTSMLTKEVKITDLWSLDTLGITDPTEKLNKVELESATHQHFLDTVKITDDGRFEVHLPWIENHPPLPNNYNLTSKRMQTTVRKLRNEGYYEAYQMLLDEWIQDGVIEEVLPHEDDTPCHYLPHRHVIKPGSTTPVRPVFDASARENKNPSLNQCLEKGPNHIEKIPSVLARFRLRKIGVTSDIRRAFLQIGITPYDRDFLRFLWLNTEGNLKIYRHCRVVFGLSPSPYQLGACIDLHLERVKAECDEGKRSYPADLIVQLRSSFYVDNCLTSVEDEEKAQEFINVTKEVMMERGFDLRGWELSSTDNEVSPSNVLGLLWDRNADTLSVNVSSVTSMEFESITKRLILSAAHRVFDPVGLTCCVTLLPKLMLQKTWESGQGWDQEVDEDVSTQFKLWFKEVPLLSQISIPRWLPGSNTLSQEWTLHVFSDASQKSYGAAVFLRVQTAQGVRVQLVGAKSRVSPISKPTKKMTIPRLELLAASIAARLRQSIAEDYSFRDIETIFWTDASTVLAWIQRDEPWDVFVYNRVKEIRQLTSSHQWRHVPGSMNPADLPSRGCSAKKLLESRWWEGPDWLKLPDNCWPNSEMNFDEEEIGFERKRNVVSSMLCEATPVDWYYRRFSNYKMIVRMVGWIYRYKTNWKIKKDDRVPRDLTSEEYLTAEHKVLCMVQEEAFSDVFDERLTSLLPFIDKSGLIRLMTKISYRNDARDFCHPIILPNHEHPVVFRLIMDVHKDNCHAGVQMMMSLLRQRFWIIGGRQSVRVVLNSCQICKRYTAKRIESLPTPLPETRVRNAKIFEICGVDLAGPLFLKTESGVKKKAYVCLFTCGVYRAVHLELISSQSTDSFLQGFRRFTSRRGRPSIMYSDRGTNFIGLDNACDELDWNLISQYSAVRRIEWRFNPPSSPWWGGWWERLIGVLKKLLRKVLGHSSVDFEEMLTILCDCEAIVNARPLTYVSQDPNDLTPLTPGMFLMDIEEVGVPDFDLIEAGHLQKRFKYRQNLKEVLRQRFRLEYLGQLKFASSKSPDREVEVGDIVLIESDNRKRLDWPLARVIDTIVGKDGKTRLVRLKTAKDELMRPIQRLYPLELELKPNEDSRIVGKCLRQVIDKPRMEMRPQETDVPKNEEVITTRIGRRVNKPVKLNL